MEFAAIQVFIESTDIEREDSIDSLFIVSFIVRFGDACFDITVAKSFEHGIGIGETVGHDLVTQTDHIKKTGISIT